MSEVKHGISGTSYKNGRCDCSECYEAHRKHQNKYWAEQKSLIQSGEKNIPHGVITGYSRGCRCDACKVANAEYQRAYRKRRRQQVQDGVEMEHGTTVGYGFGCRCLPCRAVNFCMDNKIPRENVAMIMALYEDHDGCCEICGVASASLFIDHDHATGRVRGLLCSTCNSGIGFLRDSVDLLESAIRYLQRG